ncbi:MAG: 5-formyltetrahydrofolate cyclo-ligase [Burkholderiaceae bacterium]|nr:5-formyltetrahydrofolate cyclo-ligase [Burkholderiaceae bacterium]
MSDEAAAVPAWMAWRRAERSRLIAARLAMPARARRECARLIGAALDRLLPEPAGLVVAVYWPIRGEPDLRAWIDSIRSRGARCALPVVAARGAPLVFREWSADARLVPGVWNIPEPADGEALAPQVVIAPLVGHDRRGYRLGYGGGYYDRTLAACAARPFAIGVGYRAAGLAGFEPQPHDIPMDAIVHEGGASLHGHEDPTRLPTFVVGPEKP